MTVAKSATRPARRAGRVIGKSLAPGAPAYAKTGFNWLTMLSPAALRTRRAQLMEQRQRAGRIQLALIVYTYALEPGFPEQAARMRRAALAFGVIASFLGDDLALDFESGAAASRLKSRLALLSLAAQSMDRQPPPDLQFERALDETVELYLVTKGTTLSERPPGDSLPWLSALLPTR